MEGFLRTPGFRRSGHSTQGQVGSNPQFTGAGRGTRTLTVLPPADFESAASTDSAIPALSSRLARERGRIIRERRARVARALIAASDHEHERALQTCAMASALKPTAPAAAPYD